MATLILALQTKGETWESVPSRTQRELTKWISREATDDASYERLLKHVKDNLDFSPFTAGIASLAVLDIERAVTAVYSPSEVYTDVERDGVWYKTRPEGQILEEFWNGLLQYDTVVTWSGRRFLLPFLMHRSSTNKVKPTMNLLEQRFLNRQKSMLHVDLLDQLTYYGAMNRRPSLSLLCAAYHLPLPPEPDPNDTLAEIAKKTALTTVSIAALYQHWSTYQADDSFTEQDYWN